MIKGDSEEYDLLERILFINLVTITQKYLFKVLTGLT